jgi:hypothetical protein
MISGGWQSAPEMRFQGPRIAPNSEEEATQMAGELLNRYYPKASAHREHWERNNCTHVYEYDPAEDGPEVGIIGRVAIAEFEDAVLDMHRLARRVRESAR